MINRKTLMTSGLVAIAVILVLIKYSDYLANPWTRNGMVRAIVIQVTPRVSGPVVKLAVIDNQHIKTGDLIFKIDPRTYQTALEQAEANLDHTRDNLRDLAEQVKSAAAQLEQAKSVIEQAQFEIKAAESTAIRTKADFVRAVNLIAKGDISQRSYDDTLATNDIAKADLAQARSARLQAKASRVEAEANLARSIAELGEPGEANAELRAAKAAVEDARLDLEFTEVRASVDGMITNLTLQLGSQAVANQPVLALVDENSFWIHGYFRETTIGDMQAGDKAVVTLMTYPDQPMTGKVDSLGWGIAQTDGSTSIDMLPEVDPTFEWIRLAQRVPVRIQLDPLPEGVILRVGTTASVLVKTGD
jgi:multidrug resistance efflux pump